MKRICFGTMISLLYQSRVRKADTVKTICGEIFAAYGCDINLYDKSLPSHLKSGHDPVPSSLIEAARSIPIDDVDVAFEARVIPLIHEGKHEALFRAIKAVLREDTISDTTIIGKMQGFEKKSILDHNSFDESALLANVVTYAIISTENNKCASNISEIDKDYVDSFLSSDEEIFFIVPSSDQDEFVPLKRTLKDPMFDRIFKKATELTIGELANPTKANVYYIDPVNCKFRFRDLKDFIINNIGSYVFSRANIIRITDRTKNLASVGSQAMLKFMQKYGSDAETVLGEVLLYTFLEQELDAPKIMSKIELDDYSRSSVSKSDGVHLLTIGSTGQPFHQLVFGASDIFGDLSLAVDRAFAKIAKIEENADDEFRMIESTTQWTIYDPEATNFMVDLMRPKRDGSRKTEMAFGIFLGYTINLSTPETDSQKYKVAVKEQLINDITNIKQHLIDLIDKCGLYGYSFYLYVMPFNDAPNEKTSIIKELLGGNE